MAGTVQHALKFPIKILRAVEEVLGDAPEDLHQAGLSSLETQASFDSIVLGAHIEQERSPPTAWEGLSLHSGDYTASSQSRRARHFRHLAFSSAFNFSATYLLRNATTFIFPPTCLACDEQLPYSATPADLCPSCLERLEKLQPPLCFRCGVPLARSAATSFEGQTRVVCSVCLREPPTFIEARSLYAHTGTARSFVLSLKWCDSLRTATWLAPSLVEEARHFADIADLVVPVPLHPKRLRARRYNQAAELAMHAAKRMGLPYDPLCLARCEDTQSQVGQTREERILNIASAFVVSNADAVAGKRIILVDDVVTSGATANACSKVLMAAGALEVRVLSLARRLPMQLDTGALPEFAAIARAPKVPPKPPKEENWELAA